MTVDAGIDLVAFSSVTQRAITIQVKANDAPKPGGGRGRLALDWWIAESCPAEIAAFVDLSTESVWLFAMTEMATIAQQRSNGRYHFYMYVDPTVRRRTTTRALRTDFETNLLERSAQVLFAAR